MKFLELVEKRQSVRKYTNRPVEQEKLQRCIEAAHLAPSACNAQPWKFIIINDPVLKDKVALATYDQVIYFNKFTREAPVIVAIAVEKSPVIPRYGGRVKKKPYYLMDIGIAAEHFCLQAAEEGLGTCMIGWFNERKVKNLLKVPRQRRVILLITVGYPPDDYKLRKKVRKDTDKIRTFNQY